MRAIMLITMVSLLGAAPATARTPKEKADALHKQALDHARNGRWEPAFQLWEAAEAIHGDWRYAFNQASGHAHLEHWRQAWHAIDRARTYGVPDERLAIVSDLQTRVESELLPSRALLELTLMDEGATVTLDGKAWEPPYKRWTTSTQSALLVTRDGHHSFEHQWTHAVGRQHSMVITLQKSDAAASPAPEPSVVVVERPTAAQGRFKWVLLAGGAALAVSGVVLHVTALDARDDANRLANPSDDPNRRQSYDDAVADMRARDIGAYTVYAVSALALGASVWLFVAEAKGRHIFTPTVFHDGGAGMVFNARF